MTSGQRSGFRSFLRGSPAILAMMLLAVAHAAAQRSPSNAVAAPRRTARIADSLLARMTLDEKLGQLTQAPAGYGQTGPTVDAGGEPFVDRRELE